MGNKLPVLISPDELNNAQKKTDFEQKFRVLEANLGNSSLEDFNKGHIKHALYFDVMNGSEPSEYFPRDVPKEDLFKEYVSQLGISNKHHIIIYDRSQFGFYASSRTWWLFRLFGHEKVSILNGGFNGWQKKNFEIDSEIKNYSKSEFKLKKNQSLVRYYDDIIKNIDTKKDQLVDARSREEFNKENLILGQNNIPNSLNVPYPELFDSNTGELKSLAQLKELFKNAHVNLKKSSTIYCLTGVTACSVAFSAYLLGAKKIPVYKGSWTEYSKRKEEEKTNESKEIKSSNE